MKTLTRTLLLLCLTCGVLPVARANDASPATFAGDYRGRDTAGRECQVRIEFLPAGDAYRITFTGGHSANFAGADPQPVVLPRVRAEALAQALDQGAGRAFRLPARDDGRARPRNLAWDMSGSLDADGRLAGIAIERSWNESWTGFSDRSEAVGCAF